MIYRVEHKGRFDRVSSVNLAAQSFLRHLKDYSENKNEIPYSEGIYKSNGSKK